LRALGARGAGVAAVALGRFVRELGRADPLGAFRFPIFIPPIQATITVSQRKG
jgi:hypothetical protein